MSGREFVSCVVATGDRPQFLRQAIRCFQRRTYSDAEMIVVDSGREAVEDLCAGIADVRYLRTSPDTSLAERLNLGYEQARGTILQKFDDDDYYHSTFLERAVDTLMQSGADDAIVTWDCFYVLLRGERDLRFSGHGWSAGATLCFSRALWKRVRFRGNVPSDYFFINDSGATLRHVCAPELYMLVRHGGNMWRTLGGNDVDAHFRALPPCGVRVSDIVDRADLDFYESLTES